MKRLLLALAISLSSAGASAELTFSGGVESDFGGYNPSGTTGTQTHGRVDPLISTGVGGTLLVTFLGFEALDMDVLTFGPRSTNLVNQTGVADVTTISVASPAGPLGFTFMDMTTGEMVANGGNPANVFASYAVLETLVNGSYVPYTKGGLYDLVIGFNDGLRVDSDFDDLVVGVRLVSEVPEPGTFALLLAGLSAGALVSRRRRKASR